MIWAIDQGSSSGKTLDDYHGGVFLQKASVFNGKGPTLSKKVLATTQHETDAQHSCYTTFCGQECAPGYSGVSQMKGRVGELGAATACTGTDFQTLCCATATFLGRCKWYGWRGEGLSCQGGCPSDHTLIAVNTNHYFNYPEQKFLEDQTCAGGTQSYCCNNVKASPMFGKDIELVDHSDLESDPKNLAKRATAECAVFGVIAGGIFVWATVATGGFFALTGGALAGAIATNICAKSGMDKASTAALIGGYNTRLAASGGANQKSNSKPANTNTKPGKKVDSNAGFYGRYKIADFSTTATCQVTYTCEYGLGFDQVSWST